MSQEYIVKDGDSLWSIAEQSGVSLAELKEANEHLASRRPPYGVNPGDRILIPNSVPMSPASVVADVVLPVQTKRSKGTLDAAKSVGRLPAKELSGANVTKSQYVVKPGDSLWSIANEHGVTFNELKEANKHLGSRNPPYGINPGDKLSVPSKLPPMSKNQAPASTKQSCIQCHFDALTMTCGHARDYELKWPNATGQNAVLQVIASEKVKEKVTISAKGSCDTGHDSCPGLRVRGNGMTQEGTKSIKASVTLPRTDSFESYAYFFEHIFVPNARPTSYDVLAIRCDGVEKRVATIEAFPKVEWKGEISVVFSHEPHKDSNFNQQRGYSKLRVNGRWKVEANVKVSCDDRTWTLGLPTVKTTAGHYRENKLDSAIFRGIQGFLDKVTPIFTSLIDTVGTSSAFGQIVIEWPNLKLSGNLRNEETNAAATVKCVGAMALALDPLLELGVKIDILNWIIVWFSAGIGKFLVDVKQRVADGLGGDLAEVKAEIAILLEVVGKIKGTLGWQSDGVQWETSGEVSMELPISIEGKASAEVRVFVFKAGAGAKAGARTSIGAKLKGEPSERGPAFGGQLYFGGITVYYSYYYEIGGATIKGSKPKPKPSKKLDPSDASFKDEYEHEEVLVESVAWPAEPTRTSLTGA